MEWMNQKKIGYLLGIALFCSAMPIYANTSTMLKEDVFEIPLKEEDRATVYTMMEGYIGTLELDLPIEGKEEKAFIQVVLQDESGESPVTFKLECEEKEEMTYDISHNRWYYDEVSKSFMSKKAKGKSEETEKGVAVSYEGSGLTEVVMHYEKDGKEYFRAGYEHVLFITQEEQDYFMKHGRLRPETSYGWPGLRELLGAPVSQVTLKQVITPSKTVKVIVNGKSAEVECYTIEDNSYFKLRDLAWLLKGTEKGFAIGWDPIAKSITLTSGMTYKGTETSLKKGDGKLHEAVLSQATLFIDNIPVFLSGYTVEGSNYFKLRDLASNLHFYIGWDEPTKSITIDTTRNYEK